MLVCAGCAGVDGYDTSAVNPAALVIERDGLQVATATIGAGRHARPGTYALVDVRNPLPEAVEVELSGDLLDGSGADVGALYPESLRIPPGGVRTFALVHHGGEVPSAADAKVWVRRARVTLHTPVITIEDGNVWQDVGQDRVIVSGNVVNGADRDAKAVVVAGFYDAEGRVLQRPWVELQIARGNKEGARFVGPAGSVKGYMFVADVAY